LLGAQRDYPAIPKLPLRDTVTAPTCPEHPAAMVIEKFLNGQLTLHRAPVLEAVCGDERICGINDLVIRSRQYVSALRYRVTIDGELYAREIVGDGVCFAGVHGSTAYYRSITRGIFRVGVGLAFCNSTEVVDHLVLPENSVVEVEILRGEALVMADNDPEKLHLTVGEKVTLQQTAEYALVHGLDGFMCPECRYLRHHLLSLNEKRC
jgi:NAD+ kinase